MAAHAPTGPRGKYAHGAPSAAPSAQGPTQDGMSSQPLSRSRCRAGREGGQIPEKSGAQVRRRPTLFASSVQRAADGRFSSTRSGCMTVLGNALRSCWA